MISEKLVQQVREGKASIWVVDVRALGVNNRINTVKGEVYPKSPFTFERAKYFYFRDDRWYYANTNPTGLTPIPLDDFFKEEGTYSEEELAEIKEMESRIVNTPPTQSSLPSGVQTMPIDIFDVMMAFVNKDDKMTIHRKDFMEVAKLISATLATPSLPPSEEKGVEVIRFLMGKSKQFDVDINSLNIHMTSGKIHVSKYTPGHIEMFKTLEII